MAKIQLDLPDELHKELKTEAINNGTSLKDVVMGRIGASPALDYMSKPGEKTFTKDVREVEKMIDAEHTCKNGHPSKDGKHCHNAKCVYGQ